MDFQGLADLFETVKAEDDKLIESLADRLGKYREKRPEVLSRAHAYVDGRAEALKKMEDGLNKLDNAIPTPPEAQK